MIHAGDLTPDETFELLSDRPEAVLVDVRTREEWAFVGVPEAPGSSLRFIEWTTADGTRNPHFLEQLADIDPDTPIAFLCRSGHRSALAAAAATKAGYTEAYNVSQGFEGSLDTSRHRVGGWKGAGLPWHQT